MRNPRHIMALSLIGATLCVVFANSAQSQQQVSATDTQGVYRQGSGVVMPKALKTVNASFTEMAASRKVSGVAKVQIIVDADGSIRDPRIIRSVADDYSNPEDHRAALSLDQSALDAVAHYVFEPGSFHGKAVPVYVNVDISFQIYRQPVQDRPKDPNQPAIQEQPKISEQPSAVQDNPKDPNAGVIYGRVPGVVMPKLLKSVEPSFTEEARKRRINGQATLQVIVNADGTIRSVRITKSIADAYTSPKDKAAAESLDQQAIEAVRHYVFSPGTYHDEPVPTWLPVQVEFNIH